jgi:hypothetical protein
MRIETYLPSDMSLLSADATGVDFGEAFIGQHSNVVAIRPFVTTEVSFESLALFLEDSGGLGHTQFGKYKNGSPIQGITPGSDYLSDFFIPVPGVSDASLIGVYSDFGLVFEGSSPEYAWIDAEAGPSETAGSASVNFRFVFEYN